MGLIRFLVICIIVLYLLRFLVRMLLPQIFFGMANRAQNRADEHFRRQQEEYRRQEGRMRIDHMPERKPGQFDNAGEFVEYEEVKDR